MKLRFSFDMIKFSKIFHLHYDDHHFLYFLRNMCIEILYLHNIIKFLKPK